MIPAIDRRNSASNQPEFDSVAWLMVGCRITTAGQLALRDGCLKFTDADGQVRFGTLVREIESVWSPWYYFGGGLKLTRRGETYRLTFVLPNDQPAALGGWRRIYGSAACQITMSRLEMIFPEIVLGRMLTRRWLELLTE